MTVPPSPVLTNWIQPGALLTLLLGLAGFFWRELKDQKAELRAEIKEVRAEVKEVRAEVKEVRAEVKESRAEVREVRAEVRTLNNKLDRLLESLLGAKS